MSKKTFEGKQYQILEIIGEIESRKREEPEQVQFVLKEAVLSLNRAFIFADYIDSYLSGDIDEEVLFRILFVELGKLEEKSQAIEYKCGDKVVSPNGYEFNVLTKEGRLGVVDEDGTFCELQHCDLMGYRRLKKRNDE